MLDGNKIMIIHEEKVECGFGEKKSSNFQGPREKSIRLLRFPRAFCKSAIASCPLDGSLATRYIEAGEPFNDLGPTHCLKYFWINVRSLLFEIDKGVLLKTTFRFLPERLPVRGFLELMVRTNLYKICFSGVSAYHLSNLISQSSLYLTGTLQ